MSPFQTILMRPPSALPVGVPPSMRTNVVNKDNLLGDEPGNTGASGSHHVRVVLDIPFAPDGLASVGATLGKAPQFDTGFPESERLPDRVNYLFRTDIRERDGILITKVTADGIPLGDSLTDAAWRPDGYRLHDVFHLSYATLLGWSPVTRMLLKRKRRSSAVFDENEDGGRAIAVEEGISALVFGHARRRNFFAGQMDVDDGLLTSIEEMTDGFEVACASRRDWTRTILTGFSIWRALAAYGGQGVVHADLEHQVMVFLPGGTAVLSSAA